MHYLELYEVFRPFRETFQYRYNLTDYFTITYLVPLTMHLWVLLYIFNSLGITISTIHLSAQIHLASLGPFTPVWAASTTGGEW